MIKFMKNLITFNNSLSIVNEIIKHSVAFLNNLYNKIFRTNLLKTTVFEDHSINIFEGNIAMIKETISTAIMGMPTT